MAEKIDFQVMATILMGAVHESMSGFLRAKPDKDPVIITKPLYADDKYDASAYADLIDNSYISVIYFYHNEIKGFRQHCGTIILYVNTSAINFLVGVFGFRNSAIAGDEMASDAAGELCNNITGVFKKDLRSLGYPELEISVPSRYKGFTGGVDYPRGEKNFYRMTACFWGQTIVLDVILGVKGK